MDGNVEEQIAAWRGFVRRRPTIAKADVEELEGHLRDRIDDLRARGLSDDEAFLVAVRRMGQLDELSREFAREHSDRLWKQLVIGDAAAERSRPNGLVLAVALAAGAALAIKLPSLLGADAGVTLRNAALLVLPFLAGYFLIRRRASRATLLAVAAWFAVVAVLANVFPFVRGDLTMAGEPTSMTEALIVLHAPIVLWGAVGVAYAGGAWLSSRARMDAIRFTGELVVYLTLIALGGGVLSALTLGAFSAVGIDAEPIVQNWVLPCGAAGAVVIAGWLVEAKQSVIENIAPVLTRVFTPLFTVLLLALIAAGIVQRNLVVADRDLLIVFDLVLVVVLGLLLYALSARDAATPPSMFDRLQLVMVVAALVVDGFVLVAMIGRIGEFGASANKVASLGLNLILLVNLAVAAWLQWRFVRGQVPLARLERWQTGYLPAYTVWAVIVIGALPPVFGYV